MNKNSEVPEIRPSLVAMATGRKDAQAIAELEQALKLQDELNAGEAPPNLRPDLVAAAVGKSEDEIKRLQDAAVQNGELYPDGKAVKLTGDKDLDEMLSMCIATTASKGAEYTIGSTDRLANFRRVAEMVETTMPKVWFTYFYKHYSAVVSYIKNDCHVKSNEPISGRIMDCIVYLMLFHKMVKEIEAARKTDVPIAPPVV